MWNWNYESCDRCGSCYKLLTDWSDELWVKINGSKFGCLCPECVISIAQERKIEINKNDIELIWLFDPDNVCGGYKDLFKLDKKL